MSFKILSLDGGGFRGLAQAWILAEIEERTGCRTVDRFDLISGTSTGGILALALSLGKPARELVDFYIEDGRRIFGSGKRNHIYRKLRWPFWAKYNAKVLEHAIRKRLGDYYLGDAETRLVIPAFDLGLRKPYLFKTDHRADYQSDWTRSMWEIGMATSAAPTYFTPFKSSWGVHFSDGGLWANNPTQVALTEATQILKVPLEEIRVLNLGNGRIAHGKGSPSPPKKGGYLAWASDTPELILQANAISVAELSKLCLGTRYTRVEPDLSGESCPLDRYDPSSLRSHATEAVRRYPHIIEPFFESTVSTFDRCRRTAISL